MPINVDYRADTSGLEPALGNPSVDGYILSSTVLGVRSWVAAGSGTGDMLTSTYDPAGIAEQLVGLTAVQTLTNKTLTSPVINSPTGITASDVAAEPTLGNPTTDGYVLSSTAAGVRSWIAGGGGAPGGTDGQVQYNNGGVLGGASGLFYDDTTGDVGIGTASPAYKLDIKASSSVGAVAFTGTGLNDATSGGTFTGSAAANYRVQIDATGTPDTFEWSGDGGTTWHSTGVAIDGTAQTLNNGVTITFAATTGHTLGDYWDFATTVTNPLAVQNAAGTRTLFVGNDGTVGYSGVDTNIETLSGDKTLTVGVNKRYQLLNPNNTVRHITLDTSSATAGDMWVIENTQSSYGNNNVQLRIYSNGTWKDTLAMGASGTYIYTQTGWSRMYERYSNGVSLGQFASGAVGGVAVGANAYAFSYGIGIGRDSKGDYSGTAVGQGANGRVSGVSIGYDSKGYYDGVSVGYYTGRSLTDYANPNKNILLGYKAGYNLTQPSAWATSTAYSLGDYVRPSTANTYNYEVTVAGTSGAAQPTWPTTLGATVTDGTVTWTCVSMRGNNNIIIGYDLEASANDADTINIGDTLYGTDIGTSDTKVGIGTATPNSKLQVAGPIATAVSVQTADYTVTASDSVVTGDATAAAFTITLPTAAGITGREYTFKKIDSSANAVTIAGYGGTETIDGATTYALSVQWQYVSIVSDGTNWLIVGNN